MQTQTKWSTSATTNFQDSIAFERINQDIPRVTYDTLFDKWTRAEGADAFTKFVQKNLHTDILAVHDGEILTIDEKFNDCTKYKDRIHRIVWETISNKELLQKTGDEKYLGWSIKAHTDIVSFIQVFEAGKGGVVRMYNLKHLQSVLTQDVLNVFAKKGTSTEKKYTSELYSIDTRELNKMGIDLCPFFDEWWCAHPQWDIACMQQERHTVNERKRSILN